MYSIAILVFGCTIDELDELVDVRIDLIVEIYFQATELRGVDEGHEVL